MSFPELTKLVHAVLARELNQVTKRGATAVVWSKLEQRGGPTSVGIGRAALTVGCMYFIGTEIQRQLRAKISEREARGNFSADLVKLLGRVPRWLSISDGADPVWVHWTKATAADWRASAVLKRRKANQTIISARCSTKVADYMEAHGIKTLDQLLDKTTKKAA